MLELSAVSKRYTRGAETVSALQDVDFTLSPGECVALVGPSGSGKSTLLALAGLMDQPTEGTVRIDGRDTTTLSDDELSRLRGRRIGFVFQSFNLLPHLTAWQNVALPLLYAGVSLPERRERSLAVLERVGLADRAGHRPVELSGGQEQRVAIARALVTNPGIILADEPTGNLDARTGESVMGYLGGVQAQGTALVIVTHSPEVAAYGDRVLTVQDGRLTDQRA